MASGWARGRKMPVWLNLAATIQAKSVWRRDWICFTWSTLQGRREDVHGAEGSTQSKRQQECKLWEYSGERKICFVLMTRPAGWCFLHRSRLPSTGLCSDEHQPVTIAKPLWCTYPALRQSYLTGSGDCHRSYSCSVDRDCLVIVSKAAESRKGHIALMVPHPSGSCNGS